MKAAIKAVGYGDNPYSQIIQCHWPHPGFTHHHPASYIDQTQGDRRVTYNSNLLDIRVFQTITFSARFPFHEVRKKKKVKNLFTTRNHSYNFPGTLRDNEQWTVKTHSEGTQGFSVFFQKDPKKMSLEPLLMAGGGLLSPNQIKHSRLQGKGLRATPTEPTLPSSNLEVSAFPPALVYPNPGKHPLT